MRSEGKVISIDGKYAVVATERRAACEGCHKRSEDGTCSVCTLLGGESRLDTRALNSAGAAVGDTVAGWAMKDAATALGEQATVCGVSRNAMYGKAGSTKND